MPTPETKPATGHNITNTKSLWESVLVEIELSVSKANFNTWFSDTYIIRRDGGTIIIGVPNEFVRTWLKEKYHKQILKVLRNLADKVRNVEYEISKSKSRAQKKTSSPDLVKKTDVRDQALPFEDDEIDRRNNLNPRYRFDSFVVGSFNELAHAAAQAVIEGPGRAYNPLFVYGRTGTGKTHLIQAVGNHFKDNHDNCLVYYVTSENFTNDYVTSVQQNRVDKFKKKYRKYSVLIMDDIQFLSNKEKTQEELFHLFNSLYDSNKQIVFSSDMHPNHLKDMESRLQSRFNAGMIVDISPPDTESRMAIVKSKAQERGLELTSDVIEYIAKSIDSNIRELEGAVNSIVAQRRLTDGTIDLSTVKQLIRNNINKRRSVSIEDVVETVTDFYNIESEKVYAKTRKRDVVKPRQITMYILREDYGIAYPTIGEKIGGRDHTTAIHSCEKIKTSLETNSDLAREIQQIRALL